MKKLIKNVNIVDKDNNFFGEILIEDGKIIDVGENFIVDEKTEVLDACGKTIMPAFVDLHVHFRDPGFTHKEDLKTGSLSALKGGYTTVNLMGNTKPICDSHEKQQDILKRAKEIDLIDIFQVVAVTKNFESEELVDYSTLKGTKFLSNDGKGVISDLMMYKALLSAKENDKTIMIHAEMEEFSKIDYRISEDLMTIRDIYLSKITDTPIHLCHVSTIDSINAVRQGKKDGVKVTCEVTPHHIYLYDNDYKVHPPIRTEKDVLALVEAIKDGTVDAIATDHAPHTAEDKLKGSPGLVGLETAFCVSYTSLVKNYGLDIKILSKLMSYGGAKLLGVNKGLIQKGYDADLVMVDLDKKIKVDSENFASKSKNTPFEAMEFFGEVLMTMRKGEIKYKK